MTSLREAAPEAIAQAWNAAVPTRYRLEAALVSQNLLNDGLLHEEASLWSDGAFVAVKRSAAALYDGPDPKVAHLSLFSDGAEDLLTRALDLLRAEGYGAAVVGTDSGHFLPGAPTDIPWMAHALKGVGFVRGGLAFDLERDLRGYVAPPSAAGEYRRLASREDAEKLDAFLAREFPGRWRFDVGRKIEREGLETVFGLFIEGECEGFALLQSGDSAFPIGGAVWRLYLGEAWGSLGPIGVSKGLRGNGYGYSLLSAALRELRESGTARTIIDWTDLVDYYGAQGFSVARTYRSYRLDLAAGR